MNRRKAIVNLLVSLGGITSVFTGYKFYSLHKKPHLDLLDRKQPLLNELAETIIPETDTPGAKEAGVGAYLVMLVKECTDTKSQNRFLQGLEDLEKYTISKYDKSFVDCNADQRENILLHFEKEGNPYKGLAGKVQQRLLGHSFFTTLRNYTVTAYCSSQKGATQGLVYDYIPGKFENTGLQPGQKSWSTN